jgi:hypothetical protein
MPLLVILMLLSQDYSQRGFVESQATFYPQSTVNDSGHAIGEVHVRHESFFRPASSFGWIHIIRPNGTGDSIGTIGVGSGRFFRYAV